MEAAGHHYCEDSWNKLKEEHNGIDESDLLKYCFSTAYIIALLHDGLGISMDDKRYVVLFLGYLLTTVNFLHWT